jgi:hypothetical protein
VGHGMANILSHYPYFVGCVLGLVVLGVIVFFFRSQRRAILLSSLMATPQAFFALYLVPGYWKPKLVAVSSVGLEDLLFMFLCGGMAWVEVSWLFRRKLTPHFRTALFFRRLLGLTAFSAAPILILAAAGVKNMLVPVCVMAAWIFIFLLIRRNLWPLAAVASVQSFVLYALSLALMKVLWPHFFLSWTWSNLLRLSVWGAPVEELAWGLAYGPFWGTAMAYLLNASLDPEPDPMQE